MASIGEDGAWRYQMNGRPGVEAMPEQTTMWVFAGMTSLESLSSRFVVPLIDPLCDVAGPNYAVRDAGELP